MACIAGVAAASLVVWSNHEAGSSKKAAAHTSDTEVQTSASALAQGTEAGNQNSAQGQVPPWTPCSADCFIVNFDVSTQFTDPVIEGSTNLPDGTKLQISLRPPPPGCVPNCAYVDGGWQGVTVENGHFKSRPFGAQPGTYLLEITANPSFEPPSVQAVVGQNGEKLSGPNLKVLGGLFPTISFAQTVQIGDGPDVNQQ